MIITDLPPLPAGASNALVIAYGVYTIFAGVGCVALIGCLIHDIFFD